LLTETFEGLFGGKAENVTLVLVVAGFEDEVDADVLGEDTRTTGETGGGL
jgi:hypothetical protein